MLTRVKFQKGMSLIEVLVAMSMSLIIAVAVIGVFTTMLQSSQNIIEKGKLDRDLNTLMDIIVSDIQRAGYWANASSHYSNPSTTSSTTDCILFSYDRDTDGSIADSEKLGYRWNSSTQKIQVRGSGSTFSCAGPTNWTDLTDPNVIQITAFSISVNTVPVAARTNSTDTTYYRTVTITISANLTTQPTVTKTLTRIIKVYNNDYQP